MKLWIDDVRPAPSDMFHEWVWVKTVHMAKEIIEVHEEDNCRFELYRPENLLQHARQYEASKIPIIRSSACRIGRCLRGRTPTTNAMRPCSTNWRKPMHTR